MASFEGSVVGNETPFREDCDGFWRKLDRRIMKKVGNETPFREDCDFR